ncbi:MAG TPA: type III pantothenate kinase [Candidatus Omnitrophota bacterium]|nr:type III pantothenate kinase [Candidatus Omnitrophota bacterium]
MLLAIDIGNTNVTCGIFAGKKLKKQFDLPTWAYNQNRLAKKLKNCPKISAAIICSVVPKLTRIIQQDLKFLTGRNAYIIGKDLVVPIENRYRIPGQVGQDRLVNAYAAVCLYACPLVVIDSGTAITFDVISKNKAYLGGLIVPGMRISLEALKEKTALLPQVELQPPKTLIGRDTKNSMLSGIIFGTAALSKEVTERIKRIIGKHLLVIGTGGNIALIKKYSGLKIKINPSLTLIGMELIYNTKIAKNSKFQKNS